MMQPAFGILNVFLGLFVIFVMILLVVFVVFRKGKK